MKYPCAQCGEVRERLLLGGNGFLHPLRGNGFLHPLRGSEATARKLPCDSGLQQRLRRSFPSLTVVASSSSSSSADWGHPIDEAAPSNSSSQSPPAKRSTWAFWQGNAAEMRAQVAKLGLAAVLAYGLFDGFTYTTFFVLAFLGYEKTTGKNPAANIQALLGIVILMWTGNNVTRPLRVAGAAAVAPFVDRGLRKIQRVLNLPNQVFAFMVVVATFATLCLSVAGFLILSRWGK